MLCLTALVGFASAEGEPDAGRLGLTLAAMLASQLAIGWTNDYRDREHDRVFQPSKPVPAGLVEARLLPWASVAAVTAALGLGAALGLLPLTFLIVGTGAGLAYDFGLKDARLSWLPLVVGLAVLPPFVWASLDVFREEFLWLYPVASPLAVAVHLANALPDLEGDARAGRGGVVVRLGRAGALRLLGACLAAPVALLGLSLLRLEYEAAVLLPAAAGYGLLLAAAGFAYRRPGREAAVWAFRLVVAASVIFAGGWLAAV